MLLTEERVHERVTPKTDWRGIFFNPIPTQVAVLGRSVSSKKYQNMIYWLSKKI